MKKVYEKPQVYMERFELAEHIAGCNLTLSSKDVSTCTASGIIGDWNMSTWFLDSTVPTCASIAESYCYESYYSNLVTINS